MPGKETVILFIVLMALLPFLVLAGPAVEFSDMENRVLQQWPTFTRESLLSARYMVEVGEYAQDQFWQRAWWVRLKNGTDRLLGRRDIGNAFLGDNGVYTEKRSLVNTQQWATNLEALVKFSQLATASRVSCYFLGVPSAYTVDPGRLPGYAITQDEYALNNELALGQQGYRYIDCLAALQGDHYFRTDHHWTALGAYAAYQVLAPAMNFTPWSLEQFQRGSFTGFYGSLYSRAPLFGVASEEVEYLFAASTPVAVTNSTGEVKDSVIFWENGLVKDKYTIFLGGVQPRLTIAQLPSSSGEGSHPTRRLLIIKDSFAHPLVPLLVSHFAEIHMIDLRFFRRSVADYFWDNQITDILFCFNLSWFAADESFASLLP
ncbi:MAG: DHHW family protein [Symbiobacteriaceae bacterium]|nr:DHHW family protein [Symbiobacteriaceae bacterium]